MVWFCQLIKTEGNLDRLDLSIKTEGGLDGLVLSIKSEGNLDGFVSMSCSKRMENFDGQF